MFVIDGVSQSTLKQAVTDAASLLVFDPSRFVILVPSDAQVSQQRSVMSAQFSSTAPRVINYDPDKPVRRLDDSSVEFSLASHIQLSSFARRLSTGSNVPAVTRQLDVIFLLYCHHTTTALQPFFWDHAPG